MNKTKSDAMILFLFEQESALECAVPVSLFVTRARHGSISAGSVEKTTVKSTRNPDRPAI
jgi:hypothetical protein